MTVDGPGASSTHQETAALVLGILTHAAALADAKHSVPADEHETRRMLNAHGIPDEEIERQLSSLSSNTAGTTAVLTSYPYLHSLHHLDAIHARSPELSLSGDAILALYRCAEICLHNMAVLSVRMKANLEAGCLGPAVSNARWRAGFEEVLYRLSALVVEVSDDPAPGHLLDLHDSAVYQTYRRGSDELRDGLMSEWTEEDTDIFHKDLDDPMRYVLFNEFANTSDERIWLSRLSRVRLPGAVQDPAEDSAVFYERMVCSGEIVAMLAALETKADTDLLPFRAVHQIAEVVASVVNRHLCGVVGQFATEPELAPSALRTLVVANRLLVVVDDVLKLLMRALTPRAYKDVRPNLGMVQGTSSLVLRKTLFNTTYPLLIRAFRLRISGLDPSVADDGEAVLERATALLARGDAEAERSTLVMQQLIVLYQHIRTWRDNHQQFPKTHLGMSPVPEMPTVSLAGSASGVDIAHRLRKAHAKDPIAPLYLAVLGTPPPDVHELISPGGFDEFMAHKTARAVLEVYAPVQERFYERMAQRNPTR